MELPVGPGGHVALEQALVVRTACVVGVGHLPDDAPGVAFEVFQAEVRHQGYLGALAWTGLAGVMSRRASAGRMSGHGPHGRRRVRARPTARDAAGRAMGRSGGVVRFSYAESMTDPSYYLPLARAAEEAGYDSMVVPDSICYPEISDTTYPFNPDGSREFLEDKPFLEPFSLIPAMGAVTERIRFVTFVIKLPIRQPVLIAKQVSSTAVLTGNRLLLGVGTSPWPEDYEICGVPWERRGTRMDEEITILRGLMAGGFFEFHGEVFDVPSIKICPTPSRPVPILIGGHHEAALKRAARDGDGWLHGGGDPADLPGLLERLSQLRAEYGTESKPFEVHVISADAYSPEGVARLEELGVTDVIVGFRWPYSTEHDTESVQTKIDNLARFADDVIAKVR